MCAAHPRPVAALRTGELTHATMAPRPLPGCWGVAVSESVVSKRLVRELARGLEPLTARFLGQLAQRCSRLPNYAHELHRNSGGLLDVTRTPWTISAVTRGINRGCWTGLPAADLFGANYLGLATQCPELLWHTPADCWSTQLHLSAAVPVEIQHRSSHSQVQRCVT